jgi:Cu/Ag efflux pump CusA
VARPTFFSLLLVTVSFVPLFTLTGQAGRLFRPLVLTHTFATFAAALLSVTLVPPLMMLVMRGRFRREDQNPVSRVLSAAYRPLIRAAVRGRWYVLAAAAALMVGTVAIALRLGSEFMPPLDEGSLLVMPTTFPGISIEEARRARRALTSLPFALTSPGSACCRPRTRSGAAGSSVSAHSTRRLSSRDRLPDERDYVSDGSSPSVAESCARHSST